MSLGVSPKLLKTINHEWTRSDTNGNDGSHTSQPEPFIIRVDSCPFVVCQNVSLGMKTLAGGRKGDSLELLSIQGAIWIRLLVSVACGKSRTGPVGLVKSPGIQTLIANEELALAA